MRHFRLIFCLILFSSCGSEEKLEVSFYSWKSKASHSEPVARTLEQAKTNSVFMHYFDVDLEEDSRDIYPVYALREVDEEFKHHEVVPVVFITNDVLKKADVRKLSTKIRNLVHQISLHHFDKKHELIQLDCDWSQSTKEKYFQLINLLNRYFEVDVTIRLHQIKYSDQTGIPPVSKGTLMLYNVGKIADENQNSILESGIVRQYINSESSYPLQLNLALPLFSQTVIKNKTNQVKLVNCTEPQVIEQNKKCFQKLGDNLFQVKSDTLYRGFYLTEGFKLKLEKVSEEEVIRSYEIIKESQLNISSIIFYHLDDRVLEEIDLNKIIEQL